MMLSEVKHTGFNITWLILYEKPNAEVQNERQSEKKREKGL